MKEHWSFNKEKLVLAEEGLKSGEPVTRRSTCNSDRLIRYMKVVLYIELILFFGWSGYTVFRSNYLTEVKSSTISTEELKSSILKDLKDTIDKIKTKENVPSKENVVLSENSPIDDQQNEQSTTRNNVTSVKWETTDKYAKFKDTLEPKSEEDKEIIVDVPSVDVNESKEGESSEERPVLEWGFPYIGHINRLSDPFKKDSSEKVIEIEDEFREPYESNERDENEDIFEFHRSSLEREIKQRNEEIGPMSAEIINNLEKFFEILKTARNNPLWEEFQPDNSPRSWDYSSESSEEEISRKSIESEKLNTSEVDETLNDSKFNFWNPPIMSTFNVSFIKPLSDDSAEKNTYEEAATNEESLYDSYNGSTQIENVDSNSSTSDIEDENYRSYINSYRWDYIPSVYDLPLTPLRMDDEDLETSTLNTIEENDSSVMNRGWEPFSDMHIESTTTLLKESVNEEKESIQFGPRLTNEDENLEVSTPNTIEENDSSVMDREGILQKESVNEEKENIQFWSRLINGVTTYRDNCIVEYWNSYKILRCSLNSANDDHASDSSSITESNSDNTMEDHVELSGENYWSPNIFSREEKVPDNTELSNEIFDIYDSSMIENLEKELRKRFP